MGHKGEIHVDQAHRGYSLAMDNHGFAAVNPLFMKYEPDADGYFAGQHGYGYRSIEDFLRAAAALREGCDVAGGVRDKLATIDETTWVTAILEAGRRSLDEGGSVQQINYDSEGVIKDITSES